MITPKDNAVALSAIHPGEHLAEELTELNMSAAELTRKAACRESCFPSRLTNNLTTAGKRKVGEFKQAS